MRINFRFVRLEANQELHTSTRHDFYIFLHLPTEMLAVQFAIFRSLNGVDTFGREVLSNLFCIKYSRRLMQYPVLTGAAVSSDGC